MSYISSIKLIFKGVEFEGNTNDKIFYDMSDHRFLCWSGVVDAFIAYDGPMDEPEVGSIWYLEIYFPRWSIVEKRPSVDAYKLRDGWIVYDLQSALMSRRVQIFPHLENFLDNSGIRDGEKFRAVLTQLE